MSYSKPPIAVVGAGPAGMFQALYLAKKKNRKVFLIEQKEEIGGFFNSEITPWGAIDPGVFIYEAVGNAIMDEVISNALPDEELNCYEGVYKDIAGNYFQGKLNTGSIYPDIRGLPRDDYIKSLGGILGSVSDKVLEMAGADNLRSYYESRFGEYFTDIALEGVANKIWQQPLEKLTPWAAKIIHLQRLITHDHELVSNLKLSPALDSLLGFTDQMKVKIDDVEKKPKSYYPKKYGLINLVSGIKKQLQEYDVEVLTSSSVNGFECFDNKISSLDVLSNNEKLKIEISSVLWTSPPIALLPLLDIQASKLPDPFIPHRIVYLFLDEPPEISNLYWFWSYDQNNSIVRGAAPAAFCPDVVSRGYYPLCLETHIPDQNMKQEDIVSQVIKDVKNMELVNKNTKILGSWIIKSANSYFVPTIDNTKYLSQLLASIDTKKPSNLVLSSQNISEGVFYMRDVLRANLPVLDSDIF